MTRDPLRLPYIDALRGCAIIMVVLVHTAQAVPGLSSVARGFAWSGQMGVQLFFLASAYSLCFVQEQQHNHQNPTLSFYIRRYFRVAPLYYVSIVFYGLLAALSPPDGIWAHPGNYTAPTIAANALLIHGFVENGNNSVVPGGWSVGTEVAFYLVFPVLWNFVQRKKDDRLRRVSVPLFAALALSALYVAWNAVHGTVISNNSFSYFNIASQLPVFLLGMIAYVMWPEKKDAGFPHLALPLLLLFATLSVLLVAKNVSFAFSLLPITSGLAFTQVLRILRGLPEIRWLQAIGRQSYAIYIVHFIFAWHLSKALANNFGATIPADALWLLLSTVAIASSYTAAWLIGSPIETLGIACGRVVVRHLSRDQYVRGHLQESTRRMRPEFLPAPIPAVPQLASIKPFIIP